MAILSVVILRRRKNNNTREYWFQHIPGVSLSFTHIKWQIKIKIRSKLNWYQRKTLNIKHKCYLMNKQNFSYLHHSKLWSNAWVLLHLSCNGWQTIQRLQIICILSNPRVPNTNRQVDHILRNAKRSI